MTEQRGRSLGGVIALSAFIATVLVANWLVQFIVPVGFGLVAPAAVYSVGAAFTFRDFVHELLGVRWVLIGIVVGALLSTAIAPAQIALASGCAFLFSELADLSIYAPLRRRRWLSAIVASNAVGLVVDSLIFLALAVPLGSDRFDFLPGQILGKATMTLAALVLIAVLRRGRRPT